MFHYLQQSSIINQKASRIANRMSDNESSEQKQTQSHNKLGIEVHEQEGNNQNMFNFRERSRHNSSDHQNSFEDHDLVIKQQPESKTGAEDHVKEQKGLSIQIDSSNPSVIPQNETKIDETQLNKTKKGQQDKQKETVSNNNDKNDQKQVNQKGTNEIQEKPMNSQDNDKQSKQQTPTKNDTQSNVKPQITKEQVKIESSQILENKKLVETIQKQQRNEPQKIIQSPKQTKEQENKTKSPKQKFELGSSPKLVGKKEDVKQTIQEEKPDVKNEGNEKYERQIEDDIANLKKNLVKKKKVSPLVNNQVNEKKKLNQTVMTKTNSNELQFDQTPQTRAMEVKMISTMALEKKKQNYNLLREWDKRRADSLAVHRNMIEILQNQIDKRIKSSIQNLEIYTTFLREKAKQQQKYLSHPVINTKYALQNNSISKNVYINCTVILNTLSEQNNLRCKKIADFLQIVRNDILKDTIQSHLMQSQKQLLKVREKISSLKAALRKSNSETEQKTNELALFFNQNSVKLNLQSQKDFFLTQLQFLSKAFQQTVIQKKLGENCFQYLQTAINQEIKRSKVIRDCMIIFIKALEQCFNIETDPAEIQQLSKAEENKLIKEFYSLEQIFDQRCLTVFKSHEHIDETKQLTNELFLNFLKKLQFEGFDCRMLLLKQYNTKYLASSKTEPINQSQSCYLVITVDKWIHLFFSKEKTDQYARPDISIKATLKNLQLKPIKNQILEIILKDERKPSMISYFWDNKSNERVYRVEFAKKDNREEFMDFIKKLRG